MGQLGPREMTTNGPHRVTDAESPRPADEAPSSLNGQWVDERLEALLQTIRTWDWRAEVAEVDPPPADVATTTVPHPATTTSIEAQEEPQLLVRDPSPFRGIADTQPLVIEPTPRSVAVAPPTETDAPPVKAVALPSETVDPPVEVAPPLEVDPSVEGTLGDVAVDRTSWFGHEPEPEPEPDGPIRRLWSHRTTKLAVLGLTAVVVVVLIIGGIRLFAKSPGSPGPSATTVTQPASRPVHHNHFVAPISAEQLTQYQRYAAALQNANLAAIRGFDRAGSTPTTAQVVLVVVAYRTAVNLYDFQLHFIQWPQSMQSAIEADHAQLQTLTSFLQAFSSVTPDGVPAWLTQLHNRTGFTQTADNVVRRDLGLPATSSFP
jgi:hypothetical protein